MVLFPNCKINIGLDVLSRRADGFHELSTVMYPIRGLCDALEIVLADKGDTDGDDICEDFTFTTGGITVDCDPENNICVRAFQLMQRQFGISGMKMHLQKAIPFGAGLGGGSADAAFAIRGINSLFELGLDTDKMESLAAELGSDTSFFIKNSPALASSRGEVLSDITLDLGGYYIIIAKPTFGVSTAEAYSGVSPRIPSVALSQRIAADIHTWRETITNDFEHHIFELYPQIGAIKQQLYDCGAVYASMSGSGSAVYGIFAQKPRTCDIPRETIIYQGIIL